MILYFSNLPYQGVKTRVGHTWFDLAGGVTRVYGPFSPQPRKGMIDSMGKRSMIIEILWGMDFDELDSIIDEILDKRQ